ncbi:hypothetical protein [Streptomyces chumphonensis]|uniref:hypothetical protein n=1 Tax=Streptomyces chumphonensis TaxID=1214925 RepID=UPI003D7583CF
MYDRQRFPLPGAVLYPDDSRPRPARAEPGDDRWVTGLCWLYCRRADVPVIWIGPAAFNGMHAPMHACERCLSELEFMIWHHFTEQ